MEENLKENTIVDKLKLENKILQIQYDYERGKIKENDLSDEIKNQMLSLYNKQIMTLEYDISICEKTLEQYKQKIIYMRKRTKS